MRWVRLCKEKLRNYLSTAHKKGKVRTLTELIELPSGEGAKWMATLNDGYGESRRTIVLWDSIILQTTWHEQSFRNFDKNQAKGTSESTEPWVHETSVGESRKRDYDDDLDSSEGVTRKRSRSLTKDMDDTEYTRNGRESGWRSWNDKKHQQYARHGGNWEESRAWTTASASNQGRCDDKWKSPSQSSNSNWKSYYGNDESGSSWKKGNQWSSNRGSAKYRSDSTDKSSKWSSRSWKDNDDKGKW